jgi:cobalt/nickel transport system permease protein
MHIGENILAGTPEGKCILLAGAVAAAAGTFIGLRRLDEEQIPKAAVLGSAFFVASAIQVPLLGSSVHLILSGLMGLVLGWVIFPAVLVALVLQLAFFSIGGPTVLGLNTVIMALPGVICFYLFGAAVRGTTRPTIYAAGFAAGATGVVLGALLSSSALLFTDRTFAVLAGVFLASHLPVALIEGLVTGSVVVLLRQVRPEVLRAPLLVPIANEAADG